MRVVNVKQNGAEWKEWRGKGLGASDAPAIMGISPWTSILELYLERTGLSPKTEPSPFAIAAMRRGTELEPNARILFQQYNGNDYPPMSAEHDVFGFIRASFDGYNSDTNSILEIKCPGKVDHATALKGNVPEKYYPQLQQQLLVSGAGICDYFSWDGISPRGAHIVVEPDYEFQAELLGELISFWDCVTNNIMPIVTPSDIARITRQLARKSEEISQLTKVLELITQGVVPKVKTSITKGNLKHVR